MVKTEQRALYPWETPQCSGQPQYSGQPQAKGCEQPLEDSTTIPAQQFIQLDLPAAPAYVLAHAFQGSQVTLLWGGTGGADGYLVLRGENLSGLKPVAAVEQASYIDSQTVPGKTYYYAVRAYNENGQSAATPAATVTLPAVSVPEPEAVPNPEPAIEPAAEPSLAAPEAPVDLRASIRGTHLVELRWQGDPRADTQYRLFRSAMPWCSYGLVAETGDCRFLDTVPEAGTKYYYFVQAAREGRSSRASAMAEALAFPELPPPESPERLRAAPVPPDAVELHWPHARGAAAYAVYARMEGGDFHVVGHTLDGGFLHEGLPADINMDYRVQSYHGTGVSEPSGTVTVRTGASRQPNARPSRPSPPQNSPHKACGLRGDPGSRRFPAFSLQGLQNPLIK